MYVAGRVFIMVFNGTSEEGTSELFETQNVCDNRTSVISDAQVRRRVAP